MRHPAPYTPRGEEAEAAYLEYMERFYQEQSKMRTGRVKLHPKTLAMPDAVLDRFPANHHPMVPWRTLEDLEETKRGRRPKRDWHKVWRRGEPPCGTNQWRQKDRMAVINICDMGDGHLGHAIRFASGMRQHALRLSALLAERARREVI